MEEKGKTFWELILSKSSDRTYRASAPGGWLVKYYFTAGKDSASAMAFVADEAGQWEVSETYDWEKIQNNKNPNNANKTFRLEVPEGWLVRDGYKARDRCLDLHMVFVPDPEHSWKL